MLGVGFFLQTNFDFLSSHFNVLTEDFLLFKKFCCTERKFEKMFHLFLLFVKL